MAEERLRGWLQWADSHEELAGGGATNAQVLLLLHLCRRCNVENIAGYYDHDLSNMQGRALLLRSYGMRHCRLAR